MDFDVLGEGEDHCPISEGGGVVTSGLFGVKGSGKEEAISDATEAVSD